MILRIVIAKTKRNTFFTDNYQRTIKAIKNT